MATKPMPSRPGSTTNHALSRHPHRVQDRTDPGDEPGRRGSHHNEHGEYRNGDHRPPEGVQLNADHIWSVQDQAAAEVEQAAGDYRQAGGDNESNQASQNRLTIVCFDMDLTSPLQHP